MSSRCGIVGCALFFLAAAATADPFADFRIPAHVVRSASLGISGSAGWDAGSRDGFERRDQVSANPHARISRVYDSDAWQYGAGASVSALADRRRQREDTSSGDLFSVRDELYEARLGASASIRAYPWRQPIGFGLSVQTDQSYYRDTSRSDHYDASGEQHVARTTRRSWRRVVVSASPGWGRVRDATVVYDVHVLEERLREAGLLVQPLSVTARERLAEMLTLGLDFYTVHDRASRFFWREVERFLIAEDALGPAGFDAWSLERVQEGFGPGSAVWWGVGQQRLRGYFVGAAVEAEHQHEGRRELDVRSGNGYALDTNSVLTHDYDRVFAGPRLAVHIPIGWRWQVGADARVLFPLRTGEEGLKALSVAQAGWEVFDRWRVDVAVKHERDSFEGRDSMIPESNSWQIDWGGGIVYDLEDHVEASARFVQQQQAYRAPDVHRWTRDSSINFGIAYRFWALLDAPGLIEPQRAFVP